MESSAGGRRRPWEAAVCTIVAADTVDFCYRACSVCDRSLPADSRCPLCAPRSTPNPPPPSTLLYRLLLSIATGEKVMVVVCFDRAARALMGCSADELSRFCAAHPSAAARAGEVLEGEMCRMSLQGSKSGNAEHLRVASVAPLRSGFRPVIDALRSVYGVGASDARQ
ncbi:uncharacterized protein LOC109714184 isoform X3 [Ananas comosus]|uniref:Uncharacterized protein LOC109714184 isoform X3 n=1 Tax=Ananas comosus TaxID=4615 RepID=A0A199W5L0_ANACO|nr:uncharacterized protein LOC109714184 isoform X3 [Ananas comosus]XP_020094254.1 uncharacterized protein LOC109714184 isoform X3 [Ananas comosus]XP_020094255.1 uncharacterized protein LOC109714184 isoform X3 [Ananas comosus]OAY84536.1 hypothetical protein ACMD2_03609 [Ananas comosus]